MAPGCGDGIVQPGEECDDANDNNDDACVSCTLAVCGDGVVLEGTEQCDDGNVLDSDACLSTCEPATCGDGFVQAGVEDCDDKNQVDADACSNACKTATCTDKLKNAAETDIDCGGGTCSDCADGKVCKVADDCTSGTCTNGKCAQQTLMVPNCMAANVTAAMVFPMVLQPSCNCHQGGSGGLVMSSVATLLGNTVNVDASQADMKRITPNNVDQSYLLYKVFGQQNNVPGGGGSKMPIGSMLTPTQQCLLVNWVKSGAK